MMQIVSREKVVNIVIAIGLLFCTSLAQSKAYSLNDLYEKALQKKEFSEVNKGLKGAAESRESQAYSYLYPTLTGNGTYEKSKYETQNDVVSSSGEGRYVGLNLRQNLFKGGTIAGIQREKKSVEVTNTEILTRKLDLFETVANSYYRILTLENFLVVLKELERVSDRRVTILKKRVSIGRSKKSDLLTNEVQNQNLKFEIIQTQTDLNNEKEKLSLLTLLQKDMELDSDANIPQLKPLDFYESKIRSNPEVVSQKGKSEIAKYDLEILQAQHLPSLYADLDASYGRFTSDKEGTVYSGMLRLEIPLFEGGRTRAAAQEAQFQELIENQKYTLSLSSKQVEIKNEYENLKKWLELLKISEETLKTAEANYKLFNKELELGLVSNLELLNSVNTFLETKKNRDESFYQLKLTEIRMSRLIGEKKL